ncbi:MAG: bifunctional DNA-formamidopyrimidine glycosylase/DNA-(apurinic or apyrimidinic site) lyase [Actinomycetota bacterium]|nr:bifunctional DNA-formamidopyrimidine glycosylase/DNA-(apurinic or apyrimidinic site) lyase [Actinomycetota bacterium]
MPELPEIEVIKRDLEKEVVGRRVKEVEVRPGSNAMKIIRRHGRRKEFQDLLVGTKVEMIDRAGRYLGLHLEDDKVLVVNLGEKGLLLKTSAGDALASHTHVVIGFTIGGQLRIVDPKMNGEVFVATKEEFEKLRVEDTAIDPLDNRPFTWQQFSALLEGGHKPMKELLMDERFFCGLGNLYSDEVLFSAGIRFDRASSTLTSQDVRRLYRALMEIVQDAVKARGTSWGEIEFKDLQGDPGQYQLELKVYEREGEACRRCRHEIVKEQVGDDYTYFCPQCQS